MIPDGYKGAALPRSPTIYAEIADTLGCEAAVVRAVVSVEAAGRGFLPDGRPKILYERHVFHRLTGGRFDAVAPAISNGQAGGYRGGALEYDRLDLAADLDADAALRSASWGLGQLMGFNATLCGFDGVVPFVCAMCAGEDHQLWAFASFVKSAGLVDELRGKEFAAFAKGYNGPAYARNQYDTKLVAAYARALAEARDPAGDPARKSIAEVQVLLTLAGYPVALDGWAGPATRAAVRLFQLDNGLVPDGVAGPLTIAALKAEVPIPAKPPTNEAP